ncbi:MAG: hypothetical protein ACOC9Y_06080 [Chloroflexota bacterium]
MAEVRDVGDDAIRERWLANLRAAGISVPEADQERILGEWVKRSGTLDEVLARARAMEESPDYLADTVREELDRG